MACALPEMAKRADEHHGDASSQAPVGILAGGGELPIAIARSLFESGRSAHIVGLRGEADQAIEAFPHTWVAWGGVGALLDAFAAAGCRELVIVGRVRRPDLLRIRPDIGFFRNLPKLLRLLQGGDDSVLSRVVRFFEGHGLAVRGAHEVAPQLVVGAGAYGGLAPTDGALREIERGLGLLEALGPFDIGQAAVIEAERVLAIEAAEGTDAMLARVRELRGEIDASRPGAPRGVLVKGPKPGQELRVDMPTIGPRTVEHAASAGLRGIAVRAGEVLIAERDLLHERLRTAEIFVHGIEPAVSSFEDRQGERGNRRRRWRYQRGKLAEHALAVSGRLRTEHRRDIAKALAIRAVLEPFATGGAIVVSRQYVLAVGCDEPAERVVERAGSLRQWRHWGFGRRHGIALVGSRPGHTDAGRLAATMEAAVRAELAAVAWVGPFDDRNALDAARSRARSLGLTVVTVDTPETD